MEIKKLVTKLDAKRMGKMRPNFPFGHSAAVSALEYETDETSETFLTSTNGLGSRPLSVRTACPTRIADDGMALDAPVMSHCVEAEIAEAADWEQVDESVIDAGQWLALDGCSAGGRIGTASGASGATNKAADKEKS